MFKTPNKNNCMLGYMGITLLVLTALLSACAMESPEGKLGSIKQAVREGTPATYFDERQGHIKLYSMPHGQSHTAKYFKCSGTLIWKNWVLTARHCVENYSPSKMGVQMAGKLIGASKFFKHPTHDVALIKLKSSFTITLTRFFCPASICGTNIIRTYDPYQRNASSLELKLYDKAASTLKNKTVLCYGSGYYASGQYGVLHKGSFKIYWVDSTPGFDNQYTYSLEFPNSQGQWLDSGDSGGACFLKNSAGKYELTGVMSAGTSRTGFQIPAPHIRDWVKDTWMKETYYYSIGEGIVSVDSSQFIATASSSNNSALRFSSFYPTNITGTSYTLSSSLRWNLRSAGSGRYYLVSKSSGKCMTVRSGSSSNGAVITQDTCRDRTYQRFYKYNKGSGYVTDFFGQRRYVTRWEYRAYHSSKCLTRQGTSLVQSSCNNSNSQRFYSASGTGTFPGSNNGPVYPY